MSRIRPLRVRNRRLKMLMLIPAVGILTGVAILIYPYFSQLYNQRLNDAAISSMSSVYDRYGADSPIINEIREKADMYNRLLAGVNENESLMYRPLEGYETQLSVDGSDIMAYVEIPVIGVRMPVYHGTGEESLSAGAGHLEGSSLPVGGDSTHAVLTAHSGMQKMEAFDKLILLEKGDLVGVSSLGEMLVYEVTEIETVWPDETESLAIVPGKDMLTLITCTPYGINDHRLLVHCLRTDRSLYDSNDDEERNEEYNEGEGSGSVVAKAAGWLKKIILKDLRKIPFYVTGGVAVLLLFTVTIRNIKSKRYARIKRNECVRKKRNA